jgi:hypothetical protein
MMEAICSSETLDLSGIHGFTTQKTVLFIITTVGISKRTWEYMKALTIYQEFHYSENGHIR